MRPRLLLPMLAATGLLLGCEKVDIGDDDATEDANENFLSIKPTSSGLGTQDAPLLVEQILRGDDIPSGESWVIGYVVGSTYRSMAMADFSGKASYTSNVLLSSDSLCADADRCIPVELATNAMQRLLSLPHNPSHHRQCAMVYGKPERYFSRNGLRNTSIAYWLPGFCLSDIITLPSEWNDWEASY